MHPEHTTHSGAARKLCNHSVIHVIVEKQCSFASLRWKRKTTEKHWLKATTTCCKKKLSNGRERRNPFYWTVCCRFLSLADGHFISRTGGIVHAQSPEAFVFDAKIFKLLDKSCWSWAIEVAKKTMLNRFQLACTSFSAQTDAGSPLTKEKYANLQWTLWTRTGRFAISSGQLQVLTTVIMQTQRPYQSIPFDRN